MSVDTEFLKKIWKGECKATPSALVIGRLRFEVLHTTGCDMALPFPECFDHQPEMMTRMQMDDFRRHGSKPTE